MNNIKHRKESTMNSIQTFNTCQVYAQAECACSLLDQWDLSDQFLDMIYKTLCGEQDAQLYAAACLINKSSNVQTAADSACTEACELRPDFAEYLASLLVTYTVTVDEFITVLRFAVKCIDKGLCDAYADGWLVSDMVNNVFADAVLCDNTVTFVADKRAVDLLNDLMKKL